MWHNKDNKLLPDVIHVVYVELSKVHEIMKKPIVDMTNQEKWAAFFQYANDPRRREIANKAI